jgi:hypothetical protein
MNVVRLPVAEDAPDAGTLTAVAFNYSTLQDDVATNLRLQADRIKKRISKTTQDLIDIGRAFTAAVPAMRMDMQQNQQNQTAKFFASKNMEPGLALAVARNPQATQGVLNMMTGAGKQFDHITVKDASGNERVVGWDPHKGQAFEPQAQGGSGQSAGPQIMAAGKQYNADLPADDYLAQFSPEMQAMIKGQINGDVKTTGNSRMQGMAPQAKIYAQTYANKKGIDYSDALYQQRANLISDSSKEGNATFGGMRINGNTAMGHLDTVAQSMADLNNKSLGGYWPGLAHVINDIKNNATDEQKGKVGALEDGLEKYLAEVQKYYSGSNTGGVAEREATRERFDSAKTPEEFARIIQMERDLFQSKLRSLEQHRDQVFSHDPETGKRLIGPVMFPDTQGHVEGIQKSLDILQNKKQQARQAPASPGATFGGLPPGVTVTRIQ